MRRSMRLTLDQADLASVRRFAEQFLARFDRLDLLINNASAILVPQSKTRDGFEMHFGVNHLGSFALTGLLIDRLMATQGARIVNTSSTAHRMVKGLDLADLNSDTIPYKEMQAYGKSKLAALLFTAELDRRLRKTGGSTKGRYRPSRLFQHQPQGRLPDAACHRHLRTTRRDGRPATALRGDRARYRRQ